MRESDVNKTVILCVLSVVERYCVQRYCVCGLKVAGKKHLCDKCSAIYGTRQEWPEWLKFWVNDTEREYRKEKSIDEHEISFTDLGVY